MSRDARVAYVMTHYPKHSQTFLIDEVTNVRSDDLDVVTIALNPPEPGDVASPLEQAEADRTRYVKAVPKGEVLRLVARAVRRDPLGMAAIAAGAARRARFDLAALLWQLFYVVEAVVVWDHCEREGCRHLHAQFGTTPATVAELAARIGTRLDPAGGPVTWSFTVHGYHEFTAEVDHDIAGKVRSAAFVLAVSDYSRAQLMRLSAPGAWAKIRRAPCGIALDRFPFAPRTVARSPATVVTVGRLSPEKGQFVLLDAARHLCDRGVDVRIRIVGDGPSAPELRARARELGVEDVVELTGAVPPEAVADALGDADLFCLASFAEGIPVSVMEAMAQGVPVVSTYVGGVPELVEDGVSGRTVPAGRPDLVADAIEALAVDAELRGRVQAEGRKRVERDHDLAQTSDAVRALLLDQLAGNRAITSR